MPLTKPTLPSPTVQRNAARQSPMAEADRALALADQVRMLPTPGDQKQFLMDLYRDHPERSDEIEDVMCALGLRAA